LRFLADESCDFTVVRSLRAAGHDVTAIAEINPGIDDEVVMALAHSESRILVTEDKDFGQLAFAADQRIGGIILIRYPSASRNLLGRVIVEIVGELGDRLIGAFAVIEPGRARLSRSLHGPQ
jgi:predicted nuclease of predicted toxin-antitoxin system